MYKDGKWAKQILAIQQEDGKWGWFHSLGQLSGAPLTTEQALGRLEILGYTRDDVCIQKALQYLISTNSVEVFGMFFGLIFFPQYSFLLRTLSRPKCRFCLGVRIFP